MHYYQFNIGDYAKSTLHLSDIEDLAYRRLLDRYYDTEKPLVSDIAKLCRFIRLGSYEKETQQVLEEFFSLTQKGWIQKRVAKELGAYSAKADAARANGKKGGRPKKTQSVNSDNPDLTQEKAKQEPLNIKQEPLNNKQLKDIEPSAPVKWNKKRFADELINLGADSNHVNDWMVTRGTFSETAFNGTINQIEKSGLTVAEVVKVCAESGWKGFKAEYVKDRKVAPSILNPPSQYNKYNPNPNDKLALEGDFYES